MFWRSPDWTDKMEALVLKVQRFIFVLYEEFSILIWEEWDGGGISLVGMFRMISN
jgi:hypothetical protein